jgi:hypothetical protein
MRVGTTDSSAAAKEALSNKLSMIEDAFMDG